MLQYRRRAAASPGKAREQDKHFFPMRLSVPKITSDGSSGPVTREDRDAFSCVTLRRERWGTMQSEFKHFAEVDKNSRRTAHMQCVTMRAPSRRPHWVWGGSTIAVNAT